MSEVLKGLRHTTKMEQESKRTKELLISDIEEVRSNLKRLEERLNTAGLEKVDPRFIADIAGSMDRLHNRLHELEARNKELGIQ